MRIAAISVAFATTLAACSGDTADTAPVPSPTVTPIPSLAAGALDPGTYLVSTVDPGFDASHRITISVPSGWEGFEDGSAVLNAGSGPDMGVGAGIVENTYAKPCRWESTILDPPLGPQVDDLVAALANQQGRDATTPTDINLDGYAGKYMELTTPAGIDPPPATVASSEAGDSQMGERATPNPVSANSCGSWTSTVFGSLSAPGTPPGTRRRTEPSSSRSWSPCGSIEASGAGTRAPCGGYGPLPRQIALALVWCDSSSEIACWSVLNSES